MLKMKTKVLTGIGAAFALAFAARMLTVQAAADKPRDVAPAADKPGVVTVTDKQLQYISISPIATRTFVAQSEAVGYIDFNQDKNVQVFSPWTGRILNVLARAGEDVKRGQTLFTIDSPDLINAETTLIASAGVAKLTKVALERAHGLRETQAVAEKDYEQAVSDNQTADANYRAARDAVRIFGKSDAEMDAIIATHKINGELHITSPINGRVTTRNAAEGSLVQPGNTPAPFTVADISSLWMVANVSEYDIPQLAPGQPVSVRVEAFPQRKFAGQLSNLGASVDPNTHRITVRAELADPSHQLRPQMLATFQIQTGKPAQSAAIPLSGIVREGDGTMTAFVTRDKHSFTRRVVQIGLQQDGYDQVLTGLAPGELVASDGALLLSNTLALRAR